MSSEPEEILVVCGTSPIPNPLREEEVAVILDAQARVVRLEVVVRGAEQAPRTLRWLLGRGVCPRAGALTRRIQRVLEDLRALCENRHSVESYRRVEAGLSGWSHTELQVLMAAEDVVASPQLRTRLVEANGVRLRQAREALALLRDEGVAVVDPERLDQAWRLYMGAPS